MMKAIAFFAAMLFATLATGAALAGWNGTWIGNWQAGQGTQIVFAGDTFISIYWDGDYVSDATGAMAKDGKTVTLKWTCANALITRDGPAAAHIVIHEKGKPDAAFALKPDH
jgi:hypothetical protein